MMAAEKGRVGTRLTWWILVKDLRDLLRDRRALFFAFVLPLLLYPLLFLLVAYFSSQKNGSLRERAIDLGLRGDRDALLGVLDGHGFTIAGGESLPEAVRSGELDLLVEVTDELVLENAVRARCCPSAPGSAGKRGRGRGES